VCAAGTHGGEWIGLVPRARQVYRPLASMHPRSDQRSARWQSAPVETTNAVRWAGHGSVWASSPVLPRRLHACASRVRSSSFVWSAWATSIKPVLFYWRIRYFDDCCLFIFFWNSPYVAALLSNSLSSSIDLTWCSAGSPLFSSSDFR
jgi:hypothetical protein